MMHVQLVVAEAQFAGGPVRYLLGIVHECGGLELERGIRAVARDAYILTEFISFPYNHWFRFFGHKYMKIFLKKFAISEKRLTFAIPFSKSGKNSSIAQLVRASDC